MSSSATFTAESEMPKPDLAVLVPCSVLESIKAELIEAAATADAEWERSQANKRQRRKVLKAEASEPPRPEACSACRSVKVKCKVIEGQACRRCTKNGLTCVFPGQAKRGPKEGPSKLALRYRGILRALEDNATLATDPSTSTSSSSNGASIDHASTQQGTTVNHPPRDHSDVPKPDVVQTRSRQEALALSNPFALLANVSLVPETRPPSPVANDDPFQDLLANPATYFSKGLYSSKGDDEHLVHMDPVLLGLLSYAELETYTAYYYQYLHQYIWLLSPHIHTVQFLRDRSPFLTTVLAFVVATFHPSGSYHVTPLREHVERISNSIFAEGLKSLEIVQGYCLLMHWALPAPSLVDERTWLWTGRAVRMCSELQLERPMPKQDAIRYESFRFSPFQQEELRLARSRAVMLTMASELALSVQYGRPHIRIGTLLMPILRQDWPERLPQGHQLYNYYANSHLLAMFSDTVYEIGSVPRSGSGSRTPPDLDAIMSMYARWNANVAMWEENWPDISDYVIVLLSSRKLTIAAMLHQHCGSEDFLISCEISARHIVKAAISWSDDSLVYASNFLIIYVAYAATLLLRLVHQETSRFTAEQQEDIVTDCRRMVHVFNNVDARRLNALTIASIHATRIANLIDHFKPPNVAQQGAPDNFMLSQDYLDFLGHPLWDQLSLPLQPLFDY